MLITTLWLIASGDKAQATIYVSNLDNVWTSGGIGDIHALFPGGTPYGTDTARFVTGSGSAFLINSITLEFATATPSQGWGYLNIQLYDQTGAVLLGSFGNPMVNATPTQWPGSTIFVDFSPLQSMYLNPLTQYSVVLSMPASSPVSVALLFTSTSFHYTTPTDWKMRTTLSGNPYALSESLVMAVDATPVPEPSSAALIAIVITAGGLRRAMGRRDIQT